MPPLAGPAGAVGGPPAANQPYFLCLPMIYTTNRPLLQIPGVIWYSKFIKSQKI